jgi:CRP-like cAMP-binding protein
METFSNTLFSSLPPDSRERLAKAGELVTLKRGAKISDPGEELAFALFPTAGIVSLVISMSDGASAEVGTVGDEGLVGLSILFRAGLTPLRIFQQVAGQALRIPAKRFLEEADRSPLMVARLHRFAQAFSVQNWQSTACNSLHPTEERCAKWLLMTRDRVHGNELALTQEFVAEMLGVRRPSVSVAAGALQKAGMIRYTHGKITILDHERLESAACECYRIVKAEYDRLLGA